MKIYESTANGDFITDVINMIVSDTEKDVFTLRIIGENNDGDLEILIVFTDETILMGQIEFGRMKGSFAIRFKGNFI
jgi:hypothetical protein